jgi:hypothetical protein
MAPKMTKMLLPKFICFFQFLTLFDTFLKPLRAQNVEDVTAEIAFFAFLHVFAKWVKNASKKCKKQ